MQQQTWAENKTMPYLLHYITLMDETKQVMLLLVRVVQSNDLLRMNSLNFNNPPLV
jgi:hypothetical protein